MTSCQKFEEGIIAYRNERGIDNRTHPFWNECDMPTLEMPLLEKLLSRSISDNDSSQSGKLAKAVDMWIAEELRMAGLEGDAIWPRLQRPRVLDPSVTGFIGSLNTKTAEACRTALPRLSGSDAYVMGSTYRKQVDVGMSSWLSGPEILISTKTMSSAFGKNLGNRFEEAYGDAKNLKGRHPLAALGFFFVVRSTIVDEPKNLSKAVSMLDKLQRESDAYDATCMLLVEWNEAGVARIVAENDALPESLSVAGFFKTIIELTLLRSSPETHEQAREKRYPMPVRI